MFSPVLFLVPLFAASTLAANDWSTPCLSGVCEYDLPTTNSSASGTLKIWSSNAAAISDITPAAGWTILGCAPDALEQDIRLVCNGGSDCAHLYSDSKKGAVGKIVRLPENCGKSPFAVVTNMYKSQNQSLPVSLSRRAAGSNTTVQGLSISTKFSDVGTPSTGPVNFAIRAANVPGAGGDLGTPAQLQKRVNSRAFRLPRGVADFVDGAVDDISSLNDFNVNKSTTLQPFDLDKTFNLVDQSVSCPPVDASVKIDVDAKAHAVASIGVAASGTILPPNVESFAVIVGLNAEIDGSVTMTADASGSLDSGQVSLFEVGVPGLDFPGILTIGPSFKVEGQATAKLDVDVDLTVGLSYTISGAQLVFPPDSGSNQGNGAFDIGDTPLKLSATPSASASGTLEVHLIPSLNLGISALGDTVSATVFLELDASAAMTLSANVDADASATVGRRALRYLRDIENVKARQFDDEEDGEDDSADGADDADDGSSDDADDTSADDADDTSPDDADDASDDTDDASDDADADTDDASTDADDAADDSDDDDSATDSSAETNSDDSSDDPTTDATTDDDADANGLDSDAGTGDSDDSEPNVISANDDDADASSSAESSDATDSSGDDPDTENADVDSDSATTTADAGTDAPDSTTSPTNNDTSADSTADATTTDSAGDTATADSTASTATTTSNASPTASGDTGTESPNALAVSTDANTSFGGCVEIDANLDVNAGATGSFFGLFDKTTKAELFQKKFEIFKKCFGSEATKRSLPTAPRPGLLPALPRTRSLFTSVSQRRAFSLQCPSADENANGEQQSLVDETVAASSI